jgi:capsular exopolysaccharide synthesis family protein
VLDLSVRSNNGTSELIAAPKNGAAPALIYLESPDAASPGASGRGLEEYWHVIRNRKLAIAACILLGAGIGWAISYFIVPQYEAITTLEVQGLRDNGIVSGEEAAGPAFSPEALLQTQVKVLQSASLRKRVEAVLVARGKKYEVPNRLEKWPQLARIEAIGSGSGASALPKVRVEIRIAGTSRVIEIRSDAANAQLAADFANVMSNEYIDSNLEVLWQSAQRTSEWLSHQLEEMRNQLQESESALQTYSRKSGLIYAGEPQTVDEEKLKQLQGELSRATVDRIAKQSIYEVATATIGDTVPAVADDARLNEYRSKISELRGTLADLTALYTPSHYKVKQVQAQITELEGMLKQGRQDILSRIANEYRAARRHEDMLDDVFAEQLRRVTENGNKSVYYGTLKRDVETNRQLYEQLFQRVKQVAIGSALRASNVRVLDPAEVPLAPYEPNVVRNSTMGAVSGFILAIFLIAAGEFINRTLEGPGETSYHLGVPELGVIPSKASFSSPPQTHPSKRISLSLRDSIRAESDKEALELITWQNRPSIMAESFRSALASILVTKGRNGNRSVLLVTSPSRGEGKSFVVTNLGIALAEINQKILLVDADMRKPRLHEIFGLTNSWGLSALLMERQSLVNCPLEGLARPTKVEGLYVLPAGPGPASIATLLYSKRLSDLIDRLRGEFDVVLLDTPPMSYLFDARVLGQLADGAVLVVRAGKTTRDAALSAKERMVEDGIPILGTILNDWDSKSKHRYGYYSYPNGEANL